jgi:hypothetical protein
MFFPIKSNRRVSNATKSTSRSSPSRFCGLELAAGGSITCGNTYNRLTNLLVTTAQSSGANATGQPFTGTLTVENGRTSRSALYTRFTFGARTDEFTGAVKI